MGDTNRGEKGKRAGRRVLMKKKPVNILIWVLAAASSVIVLGLLIIARSNDNYIDDKPQGTVITDVKAGESFKVYVETGHGIDENGKWDTGCTWGNDQEAKLMIPIAKATAQSLEKNGICVVTDAFENNNSNLEKALEYLDRNDIDVFVNIHCDYEFAESGTMPLYHNNEQKKLAGYINEGVHEYVDINDRGLVWRDDLETLCNKKVHCTSCLFETGCISKDNELLKTKYKEFGKGIARGICKYLGTDFHE